MRRVTKRLMPVVLASLLAACGGGGGGGGSGSNGSSGDSASGADTATLIGTAPSSNTSGLTASLATWPSYCNPSAPDPEPGFSFVTPWTSYVHTEKVSLWASEQGAALWRLNDLRALAGLSPVSTYSALELAAKNHTHYMERNSVGGHYETPGLTGYTGTTPSARMSAAGYAGSLTGEVLATTRNQSGCYAIDQLTAAIYHRFILLEPAVAEAGISLRKRSVSDGFPFVGFVMDMGRRDSYFGLWAGQPTLFPYGGQTGVPIDFMSDEEEPDPVPTSGVNRVGYPVSFQVPFDKTLNVTSFTLTPLDGAGAGTPVSTRLLSEASDPTNLTGWSSVAAIVPLAPLEYATRYSADFVGAVNGISISRSWVFTTQASVPLSILPLSATISTNQSVTLTLAGGVSPRLSSVSYVAAGKPPGKIDVLNPGSVRVTGNGSCPSACWMDLSFSQNDGTSVTRRVNIVP